VSTPRPVVDADKELGPTSQYHLRLGTEDELQFDVQVWGQVNKPGLYAVPDGTDLISLISLAGGPTDDAKLANVVLVRGGRSTAGHLTVDLEAYFSSGNRTQIPVLGPGDTVLVPAKFSHHLFRFSGILSVAVLVANVIVNATRR
jgi:polysaccharide biosynthesis/export protein